MTSVALAGVLSPRPALAQRAAGESSSEAGKKKSAKGAYEEGERAFGKGDFRRSAESFEQAYKLSPHHSALWAAARAWLRAGEDVRAANLLERYLGEAPADAPDRDRATGAIRELDKRLGRLEVVTNDVVGVKVDGASLSTPRLWVVPGEHVATGEVDGKPVRKVITVAAGDHISVSLEVVTRETPPPPPPIATNASKKPLPPWVVVVGGTLAAIGTGATIYSYTDTLDKKDAFEADRTSRTKLDNAHSAEDRTNILLVSTVGVAAVSVLAAAFLVDWTSDDKVKAALLRFKPGTRTADFGFSF